MISLLLLAGAVVLAVLGRWASANLEALADGPGPAHRRAVLRRGYHTCHGVAVLFVVAAVVRLL
ncbi:hypothetical protein [Amycolatopsis methanolica]|uniref:Integral membrane protein n=1 Tax=Amycolatopsis methanolica 239 TaxID=1068978 RepID=A0A076MX46_AMYME|nr:hypothetical protein [Amycolatopsis methanolica]AIJ23310.1 hypothetical protein AMETH_3218 [Amycolatopsis methanolica 239]